MSKLKKLGMATLICSLYMSTACSSIADAPSAGGFDKIAIQYDKFTLPNGLTVLVHSDHSVPNVFVGVWYKVGSKNEVQGKTGFAHLFEHLMFQDTIHRKGEYFAALEQVGAVNINGTTNFDRTNFFQTVPSNAIDLALWMESDRMAYLGDSIDQALLDEQRAVVKNEKRQSELRPGAKIAERFLGNFYPPGHPYDHATIGSMADLDSATLDDVAEWFERTYGASNAVLVLSGDIDVATARQKVAHYFADVPAGKPMDNIAQWVPQLTEIKRDVVYDKVPAMNLNRIWPLPNSSSQQTALMGLVARTLAGGKNTPLYDLLVDQQQVASSVRAAVQANDVSSVFSLDLVLKAGADVQVVNELIDEALATYFNTGPSQTKLDAITLSYEISLLRSMQSNEAIGNQLINGEVHHGDPLFVNTQRRWLKSASPAEIKSVAKHWLSKPYYEMQLYPLPDVQDGQGQVERSSLPAVGPFTGKVSLPEIQQLTLDNGLNVVVAAREGLPIVDISMQFETGSLADKFYAADVASHAMGLLTTGSQQYSMAELTEQMDTIGMRFNSGAGSQQSGVGWSALSDKLEASFKLAAEIIRHPVYPQSEINKVLDNIDTRFDGYEQDPMRSATTVFAKAMWGADHPFGHITRREEAKQLSREQLLSFHANEVSPHSATLYLVGDISLTRAKALAERYFGDWHQARKHNIEQIPAATGQSAKVILIDAPGAAQSSITAGHFVAAFDKDRSAVESLMDAALGGGFNARLNMNLRENKGWAYGFGGGIGNMPSGPRIFRVSGTVQSDKTAAAMREIKQEIEQYIAQQPTTEAELKRDRDASVYSIPQGFNNNGAILKTLIDADLYHLPYRRVESAAERLQAVSLEQVQSLAKQTYVPQNLLWVVVGDLKLIEQEIRDTHIGPVEVWDVYGNKLR